MDIRQERRDEMNLVGIKVEGTLRDLGRQVPQTWVELTEALKDWPEDRRPQAFYGVFQVQDFVSKDIYVYWVTVELVAGIVVPDGLATLKIPEQHYAVGTCAGKGQVEATYGRIFDWFGESGAKAPGEGFGFELFDPQRQSVTPPHTTLDYDIYWPLVACVG